MLRPNPVSDFIPLVTRGFSKQLIQILCFVAVLVMIHVINVVSGMWFTQFGVIPRTLIGLRGILFSPLLHGDWTHLLANTAPLAVMLCMLAFSRGRSLWRIVAAIWIACGIAVWLVGRPGAVQIGASGLIYGLAAFLIVHACVQHELRSFLAAVAVIFFYGSLALGLLPTRDGVSWEGHLAGAATGALLAWNWRRQPAR